MNNEEPAGTPFAFLRTVFIYNTSGEVLAQYGDVDGEWRPVDPMECDGDVHVRRPDSDVCACGRETFSDVREEAL
jgi:hypothetical protein